ncbi:hypothetical protein Btru_044758 [Bulinus truncatus]|nr:hypothetical protein Btru_044758 [Bulinus truncatus]
MWTGREVDSQQLNAVDPEGTKQLFHLVLDVLEEDNFCDFEIQFEILHNKLHAIMGGTKKYSMATLDFSAFDPFFMILHSSFDRIWIMWQKLQHLRGKPVTAQCGFKEMNKPLEPFSYPINNDEWTRENSLPSLVSDHNRLGYKVSQKIAIVNVQYVANVKSKKKSPAVAFNAMFRISLGFYPDQQFDKLTLNDFSISDIEDKIKLRKGLNRVYAGLMFSGQKQSLTVEVSYYLKFYVILCFTS